MKKVIFVVSIVMAISVSACGKNPVRNTEISPEGTETILTETILTETYENNTIYWDDI